MDISFVYDYLENHYSVMHGINAYQLKSGTCPRCERYKQDLRLYCKTEQDFQDVADSGEEEDLTTFFFASCHHCGKPISFYHFAKFYDGMTLEEARQTLYNNNNYVKTRKKQDDCIEKPFPQLIELAGDALNEAHSRGITDEMIKQYGILQTISDFEYKGRTFYYKNRIFFPIYDRTGHINGFQGRAINKSKAKYITAPWMKKSEVLYGCHEYPSGVDHLILCEGVMDKIGWRKIGANAVASFGKTISDDQMKILLDINPKVLYLAYDFDAIEKAFEFYELHGHRFNSIKFIIMPFKIDADEMEAQELLNRLRDSIEYSWEAKTMLMLKLMEDKENERRRSAEQSD